MPAQQPLTSRWIERYVAEVGRMLPANKRTDVEMEIRSLIEEEVAARAGGGASSGDELVLDVLRTFGRPHEIAARYGAQQYLVGPLLYPTFITILRVVVALVLLLNLFAQAVALAASGAWPNVGETLGNLYTAVISAAGTVVLVFALIERFGRSEVEKATAATQWDPRSLPAVEDGERVKVGETIFAIAFAVALLVALNIFFDNLGGYFVAGAGWQPMQIFSDAFRAYVPWISLWLVLDLLVNILALARGRWSAWLRWAKLGVALFSVVLLVRMLTGPALAAWPVLETSYRVTLAIILVFTIWDAGKTVWALLGRALAGRSPTPPAAAPQA